MSLIQDLKKSATSGDSNQATAKLMAEAAALIEGLLGAIECMHSITGNLYEGRWIHYGVSPEVHRRISEEYRARLTGRDEERKLARELEGHSSPNTTLALSLRSAAWLREEADHREEMLHALGALDEEGERETKREILGLRDAAARMDLLDATLTACHDAMLGKVHPKSPAWIACKTKMPRKGQRVLAKYAGVYRARVVTYWFDGVNHHFGEPPFSVPATHWCPIPA